MRVQFSFILYLIRITYIKSIFKFYNKMPQLDFYSYISQLTFIFLVSFIIYIYIINVLLPTIGITLKIRAYLIDNKVNTVNTVLEISKKSQSQLYSIIEKISELLQGISLKVKDEMLNKEILLIMVRGEYVDSLISVDLEEEFLLQSLRMRLINILIEVE